ncbi:hypothetical protein M0208_00610 [Sphingomonas sp. SUN019]|uniref:hypothetical protein n=1 Tax=Sphingomonas sp. SUN019 TaxID=2937788 RepID=UPI0021642122|nr:hypothetical protein [Sphingomonas sp. SUN019]UVO49096.1 hypothetical protein M0208_00610 [Sphingomonas sp. SUN019]
MKLAYAAALGFTLTIASVPALASDLEGPARFCGYSPIIDLLAGERVTTLEGGIHGGSFRWEGDFGILDVHGVGWASRPKGRIVKAFSASRPARFAERKIDERYQVAIWNGVHAAAYFTSPAPLTPQQLTAIDRVSLFEEGQSPSNCKLRTTVTWE